MERQWVALVKLFYGVGSRVTPVAGSYAKRTTKSTTANRYDGKTRTKMYSTENVFISVGEKTPKN